MAEARQALADETTEARAAQVRCHYGANTLTCAVAATKTSESHHDQSHAGAGSLHAQLQLLRLSESGAETCAIPLTCPSTVSCCPVQAQLQGAVEAGQAAHRERQAVASQWDEALSALARCGT